MRKRTVSSRVRRGRVAAPVEKRSAGGYGEKDEVVRGISAAALKLRRVVMLWLPRPSCACGARAANGANGANRGQASRALGPPPSAILRPSSIHPRPIHDPALAHTPAQPQPPSDAAANRLAVPSLAGIPSLRPSSLGRPEQRPKGGQGAEPVTSASVGPHERPVDRRHWSR